MIRASFCVITAITLFLSAEVHAAAPPAPAQRLEVTIHPAAPPSPALRYRLTPEYGQQVAGNGAPQYLLALELLPPQETPNQIDPLLSAPSLDKEQARAITAKYSGVFRQLEIAGDFEHCQWNLPLRQEGIFTLLPHLSRFRQAGEALALQSRLQIAEGKYEDAIHTLGIGFTMTANLRDQQGVVQAMVAAAIDTLLLDRVEEMQQKPDAPNLYWALSTLPHPLFDPQAIIAVERSWLWSTFPELRGRRIEQLSEDEWRVVFHRMSSLHGLPGAVHPNASSEIQFMTSMVSFYEAAKQQLIKQGKTPEQVSKLPVQMVIATYALKEYIRATDDLYKWAALPPWQAQAGLSRVLSRMDQQSDLHDNPLMILTPSVSNVLLHVERVERLVGRIQCVEALRAYAASHAGKLPKSLDEMIDIPAPPDPMTGKAFGYESDGTAATLRMDAVPGVDKEPEQTVRVTVK